MDNTRTAPQTGPTRLDNLNSAGSSQTYVGPTAGGKRTQLYRIFGCVEVWGRRGLDERILPPRLYGVAARVARGYTTTSEVGVQQCWGSLNKRPGDRGAIFALALSGVHPTATASRKRGNLLR